MSRCLHHGDVDEELTVSCHQVLQESLPFFLDAMCIQLRGSGSSTISVPRLLRTQASWAWPHDCNKIAHALFIGFLNSNLVRGYVASTTRHKKREIELSTETFIEAQCHSDRPAFCLCDDANDEVFHMYSAMGLPLQHGHVQVVLARTKNVEVAAKFEVSSARRGSGSRILRSLFCGTA